MDLFLSEVGVVMAAERGGTGNELRGCDRVRSRNGKRRKSRAKKREAVESVDFLKNYCESFCFYK